MVKLNRDIIFFILKVLQNDSKSLHLCLLVNRTWCETTAPILWKNPITLKQFSFHTTREICYYPNAKNFFSNLNIPLIRNPCVYILMKIMVVIIIMMMVIGDNNNDNDNYDGDNNDDGDDSDDGDDNDNDGGDGDNNNDEEEEEELYPIYIGIICYANRSKISYKFSEATIIGPK
ncbi:unnamed protein product [Rhizophagus irregularis]|nr:unnamed protein product [Rhizophagus irregularis]